MGVVLKNWGSALHLLKQVPTVLYIVHFPILVSGKYAWSWSSALLKLSPSHHVSQGGLAEPRGGEDSVLGSVWLCLFIFRLPIPFVLFLSSVFLLPESSIAALTPLFNLPFSVLVSLPYECWNITAYFTLGRI